MARPASTVALIPGDGIGREVIAEAVRVLTATGGVDLHDFAVVARRRGDAQAGRDATWRNHQRVVARHLER